MWGMALRGQWCACSRAQLCANCAPKAPPVRVRVHTPTTNERGLHAAFGCEHCQRCFDKPLKKPLSVLPLVAKNSTFLEICGASLPDACSYICNTVPAAAHAAQSGRVILLCEWRQRVVYCGRVIQTTVACLSGCSRGCCAGFSICIVAGSGGTVVNRHSKHCAVAAHTHTHTQTCAAGA